MIDFRRYTLANGLRVIHNYDPAVSMATVDVLYNVGARDERRSLTGIAHLFEHLMFGGSANVADFDLELGNAGGSSNAWTSNDITNFYETIPAVNIATALHLESDRMLAPALTDRVIDVQRSVVIEEFKQQSLNTPYGDLMHHLRRIVYDPGHPYSWPVIGLTPEHIAAATYDDVRRWAAEHYTPSNAVLAISGNVGYDHARELVEYWFDSIPSRPAIDRRLSPEVFNPGGADVTVRGNAPVPMVVIAYPMDPYGTDDYRVADCITDILSAGRSSRIYRELIADGDGSIVAADASIVGSEHPGMLMMTARLSSEEAADSAIARLKAQLGDLAGRRPVSQHELERTLNRFESTFALSNLDVASKAFNLALSEMHNQDINDTVALQRRITADDIARVAGALSATPPYILRYFKK